MHLNYDCLRDVLIELEKRLDIVNSSELTGLVSLRFKYLSIDRLCSFDELSPYPAEDVFYAIHNLHQAGFIEADIEIVSGIVSRCVVCDITHPGHEFLRSIKDETIWTLIKRKYGPQINASLPLLQDVACKLILARIGLS